MSESLPELRQRYPECAAKDCGRPSDGFSRYCRTHRVRYYVTKSPTGRILRKGQDLKPYRELARKYLARHRDNAAIVAACGWLESLMDDAMKFDLGGGVQRDLARELRRLRRDGATGSLMLERIAAVWGYAQLNPRTWADDIVQTVNLGHHALHTTPRPGKVSRPKGKAQPTFTPSSVSLELGKQIREVLGVILSQFWTAIERDTTKQARARDAINGALQGEPLA